MSPEPTVCVPDTSIVSTSPVEARISSAVPWGTWTVYSMSHVPRPSQPRGSRVRVVRLVASTVG